MSLEEFGESVWTNWRNGKGPCAGCENRDDDGHFRPKNIDNGMVSGDPNPEIVFLADAPSDKTPEGDKRRNKDTGTQYWDERAQTIAEEAESWSPVFDFLKNTRIPIWFFEELGFTPEPNGGIFYTNGKKCANIEKKKAANEQARGKCAEYLKHHLSILNPEVIVAFGNNPMNQLEEVYEFKREDSITGEAPNTVYQQEVTIVPSLHWSGVSRNLWQVEGEFDWESYWRSLATIVRTEV